MNDFTFHNPVKLIFGKGQFIKLQKNYRNTGKKYLLYTAVAALKKTVL